MSTLSDMGRGGTGGAALSTWAQHSDTSEHMAKLRCHILVCSRGRSMFLKCVLTCLQALCITLQVRPNKHSPTMVI